MNLIYIIGGVILAYLLILLVLKLINRPGLHKEIKYLHGLNKKKRG